MLVTLRNGRATMSTSPASRFIWLSQRNGQAQLVGNTTPGLGSLRACKPPDDAARSGDCDWHLDRLACVASLAWWRLERP